MAYRRGILAACLTALLCLVPAVRSLSAPYDPDVVQKRAIARIDACIDQFRRTGDMRSFIPELAQADGELASSNREYAARGDSSPLALGLINQGHIHRMQPQCPNPIQFSR